MAAPAGRSLRIRAASIAVAALPRGFNSASSSASEAGPRELLMATSWPAFTKRRAAVAPIMPAPMMPIFILVFERLYGPARPRRPRGSKPFRCR